MSRLKLELEESIKLNTQMKEEILDLQCRSMRDNLLFFTISRRLKTKKLRIVSELFKIYVHLNWKSWKTSASREPTGSAKERVERSAQLL